MGRTQHVAAVLGENLLFVIALALIVPPIKSEVHRPTYGLVPWLPLLTAAACGSRYLAWLVGRDSVVGAIIKAVAIIALGYAVHVQLNAP